MPLPPSIHSASRPAIDWKPSKATAPVNTAFESMTNGVSVFAGMQETPTKPKSLITTELPMKREPSAILRATPGRILQQEFLEGFKLTQMELFKRTGIPRSTINEIIKGKRPISAETAFTLGTFFSMDPQFWINLQSRYDLRRVEIEKSAEIRNRVQPLVATVRQTLPGSE